MPDEPFIPVQTNRWGVRLDPTVNYGHIFTAIVFLTSASMAWAVMSARQEQADVRIARLERFQEQAARDAALEAQVIARLDVKIESLDRVLVRIENFLDRTARPTRDGS